MTTSITNTLDRSATIADVSTTKRPSRLDRFLRRRVIDTLDRLRHGTLEIDEQFPGGGGHRLGDGEDLPTARIAVTDPAFYRAVALGGPNAVVDVYLAGGWDCDELVHVVRLLARNLAIIDTLSTSFTGRVARAVASGVYHLLQQNSVRGSRRHIAAHYDLGNDFFELFLDDTMTYSCGLYRDEATSLHDAQLAKIDRLIDKLDLDASQQLVEIGTGWGALAIRAVQRTGCRVTTITLSRRQHDEARRRVSVVGMDDRIDVQLVDYRDLRPAAGGFDKFVSVEMIEAVGHRYYPTYFRRLAELIKPTGRGVVQAITIADQRYERARREVDFIKRYVFPGSCIPSVEAMSRAATSGSDLRVTHLEDFTPHYARTLLDWRDKLRTNTLRVLERGYPARLLRLWEFYLAYCAGGFLERNIGLVHLELRRPECRDTPLIARSDLNRDATPWPEALRGLPCE